jgi:hypothetical protein
MVEALTAAELPKGVFNVVPGLGTVVGAELVRNPDVAKISFTGSAAVGEAIMGDAAGPDYFLILLDDFNCSALGFFTAHDDCIQPGKLFGSFG